MNFTAGVLLSSLPSLVIACSIARSVVGSIARTFPTYSSLLFVITV